MVVLCFIRLLVELYDIMFGIINASTEALSFPWRFIYSSAIVGNHNIYDASL